MPLGDRTVHAARADGCQIVRHDKAGKWYLDWPQSRMIPMERVSLSRVVDEVIAWLLVVLRPTLST